MCIRDRCMVCALEFSKKSDLKKHEKEVHMRESDTIPKMPFPKLPAFPRIQEAKEQFEPHPFPTLPPPPQEHGVGGILPCIAFIPYQGQLQPIFIPFQMPQKVLQSSRIFHNNQQYTIPQYLSLIHISEPTRPLYISYAVFCLKKKKKQLQTHTKPPQTPQQQSKQQTTYNLN
eukprot:TRINITY_DN22849_c0_g1_i2.p1 TRINITY_DN22849_c0_g1~~TRINITY_DN22849_c0_g1_i2.p1  ORF type:complete len:173 (-),score=17.81 TRINITY_DN22849_c0_g1_i2:22-540(-)